MPEKETQFTFSKDERLYAEKRIEALFASGASFIAYPLRVVYITREIESESELPTVSILTSVSKKRFKRAVKRNRVKRLIREAYRLNKKELIDFATQSGKSYDIAFLYLKSELPTYAEIEKAILKTINTLNGKYQPEAKRENNS
ncbi:ribonuclease P protein component [Dysgonomonas sp. GY617]|uniref:ribonuclease P protein component n=1 Tax=Dysgonomonas sp. GY617 TaxID=2780420 RepID=UPI001883BEBA|nr:ribonuclease P protein component [Dysgonomonas sp. GY617]MBF0577247.1 ribonuclease P protein component [Dysgonomonas sp. GY617]